MKWNKKWIRHWPFLPVGTEYVRSQNSISTGGILVACPKGTIHALASRPLDVSSITILTSYF